MNYSTSDSSIVRDQNSYKSHNYKDDSLRVGIVREVRKNKNDETRYIVEVFISGNQVPVSCKLLTRFGGVYNFEEYRIRGWSKLTSPGFLPPTTASKYNLRSGDTVLVGFINGKSKEGVILGGLDHAARSTNIADDIEYISCFNGLETKIDSSGAYTVTFNGSAVNEALLDIPGTEPTSPVYNPISSGSFFGFDSDGGFTASNNNSSSIKITKDALGGTIVLESGSNKIELGGDPFASELTVSSDRVAIESSLETSIKATTTISAEATEITLKCVRASIGNDVIELISGLIELIDAIGTVTVTSPVGTCTPVMASPQWATIEALKIKLQTLKV